MGEWNGGKLERLAGSLVRQFLRIATPSVAHGVLAEPSGPDIERVVLLLAVQCLAEAPTRLNKAAFFSRPKNQIFDTQPSGDGDTGRAHSQEVSNGDDEEVRRSPNRPPRGRTPLPQHDEERPCRRRARRCVSQKDLLLVVKAITWKSRGAQLVERECHEGPQVGACYSDEKSNEGDEDDAALHWERQRPTVCRRGGVPVAPKASVD